MRFQGVEPYVIVIAIGGIAGLALGEPAAGTLSLVFIIVAVMAGVLDRRRGDR